MRLRRGIRGTHTRHVSARRREVRCLGRRAPSLGRPPGCAAAAPEKAAAADEVSAGSSAIRDSASESDKLAERQPGVPVNDAPERAAAAPSISGRRQKKFILRPSCLCDAVEPCHFSRAASFPLFSTIFLLLALSPLFVAPRLLFSFR